MTKKSDCLYTFWVFCSFTITGKKGQPDPGGSKKGSERTKEDRDALQEELTECLGQNYSVDDLEVDADLGCSFFIGGHHERRDKPAWSRE